MAISVNVKVLSELYSQEPPGYATEQSVGIDLKACIEQSTVRLRPGERYAFEAGLAIEIQDPGIAGFVYSRSGLGTKKGLVVSQGVGVIDPDYRGEIIVSLLNTSRETRIVSRGQHIAQLIFQPAYQGRLNFVSELGETSRGSGGFGHSDLRKK
jgi:dUTP pyrophosphatase